MLQKCFSKGVACVDAPTLLDQQKSFAKFAVLIKIVANSNCGKMNSDYYQATEISLFFLAGIVLIRQQRGQ